MPCNTVSCPTCNPLMDANFSPALVGGNAFNSQYAHMGWVGFTKMNFKRAINTPNGSSIPAGSILVRITGADLHLAQEVNRADVIDGRIDSTAYWLGPKIAEGTLNFPVIADNLEGGCVETGKVQEQASKLLNAVWGWTTTRDAFGRLCYWDTDIDLRYANHAAFKYTNCLVNEFTLNVAQSDMATIDLGIMATARDASYSSSSATVMEDPQLTSFLSPARVLTWNDFTINGIGQCDYSGILFHSNQVREFNMTINNHADRFFTLNGTLFPVDINVGKREVTGTLKLLGYNHVLRQRAEANADRFTSKDEIRMAAYIGYDTALSNTTRDWTGSGISPPTGSIWGKSINGVIFQIEEVSMTNEVLETTVNYLAFGVDSGFEGGNYETFIPATSADFPAWEA